MRSWRWYSKVLLALVLVAGGLGCKGEEGTYFDAIFRSFWSADRGGLDIRADRAADLSSYKTICFVTSGASGDPLLEKDLNRAAAAILQARGYRLTSDPGVADALGSVVCWAGREETYRPPSTASWQVWNPGEQVKVTDQYGMPVGSINTPGHWEERESHRPARWEARGVRTLGFYLFDAKKTAVSASEGMVLRGIATTDATFEPSAVAGVVVTFSLAATGMWNGPEPVPSWNGMVLVPLTEDGGSFQPVVTSVPDKGILAAAGVRRFDIVAAVDGRSVLGMSPAAVVAALGDVGGSHVLTVRRGKREVQLSVGPKEAPARR